MNQDFLQLCWNGYLILYTFLSTMHSDCVESYTGNSNRHIGLSNEIP